MPKPPFLRTPYNYDTNAASDESGLECKDPSRTEQAFKDESDINNLLRRYGIGYEMPETIRMPHYGDFNEVRTFHDLMNAASEARDAFLQMPAHIRAEFNNDPAQFHDAALDPTNREKFKKLGLLDTPETPPEPKTAPTVAPPSEQ